MGVEIISWESEGSGVSSVYRIDSPAEAIRFFQDLKQNAETDGREQFQFQEISEMEWEEIQKRGDEDA